MTDHTVLTRHDAVLFDLDGTLYRGSQPLPHAAEVLARLHGEGMPLRFVTNNASKAPGAVAGHMNALGLPADPVEVNTSAQAAAQLLRQQLPAGATVLVVGTESLADELRDRELRPVRRAEERVAAVVQGHSPDTGWADLAEACVAVRSGARWVACNLDTTLPTERGQLPGNGAMVAALRAATDREPDIAGKPGLPLFRTAADSAGAQDPVVIGDRLDTDIAGAVAAGYASLVVLTGVTTPARLLAADASERPRYLATDLTGVDDPVEELEIGPRPSWQISVDHTNATVTSAGGSDSIELLRGLCHAAWQYGTTTVSAACDRAAAALAELGLV